MDKYEKFAFNTTRKLDLLVNNIDSEKTDDAFVEVYVRKHKDAIRKVASKKTLNHRQRDICRMIMSELRGVEINNVDEKVVLKALSGIGIHSEDKSLLHIALIVYTILMIATITADMLIDGVGGSVYYVILAIVNLLFTAIITGFVSCNIGDTKFRLYVVKK